MKLYTECFWDDWDRIVDIYVEKNDRFPEYINDDTTYKIVAVEKGTLGLKINGRDYTVKAPAIILLSNKDKADYKIMEKIKADIVFFNPKAVRDEFSYERIDAHDFDNQFGTIIYQDYVMILPFTNADITKPVIPISLNSLERVKNIIGSLDAQLKGQKDGFWPCRSRSFLMELLYFINYSYVIVSSGDDKDMDTETSVSFSEIVEYLDAQNVMSKFYEYASSNGVKRTQKLSAPARRQIRNAVYGNIIYDALDMEDYISFINETDPTIIKAIETLK